MTQFGNIVADPTGQQDLVDDIISADAISSSPEQAEAEEQQLQTQQLEINEPWFVANHVGPIVGCRLLPTGWQIVINDLGCPLTVKQKNDLVNFLTLTLRRHNKRQALDLRIKNVRSQAQKDAEIQAALQESFKRGELTGV